MSKGILVGNGFSSQIIKEYENIEMLKSFEKEAPLIYQDILNKFNVLRNCYENYKDKETFKDNVISIIAKDNDKKTINELYTNVIIDSCLYEELDNTALYGLETIIKIAKLFRINNINYIEKIAVDICENKGNNGINATMDIDIIKCKNFFSNFEYVFTTNYDYLLDDLCDKEVYHIHGGFDYFKVFYNKNHATEVNRYDARNEDFSNKRYNNDSIMYIIKPFLIWGCNDKEKVSKMGGGLSFPITIPFSFPLSLIRNHLDSIGSEKIEELHVLGYSGLNDNHINNAIKKNLSIKRIIYYCDPDGELGNVDFYNKISDLFITNDTVLCLESWNNIWKKLK